MLTDGVCLAMGCPAVSDAGSVVRGVALRVLGGEPDTRRVPRLAGPALRIARGRADGLSTPGGEGLEVEGR